MKTRWILLLTFLCVGAIAAAGIRGGAADATWTVLEPGLELGTFPVRLDDATGPPEIRVVRVDPARFRIRLLNASAPGEGTARTAREWCERHGLVAAINASMYQADLKSSVSLMRARGHVNNPRVSKDMAVLAFDPLVPGIPHLQIVDRECEDLDALRPRYGSLVQSIRMISCRGQNVWSQQPRRSSAAVLGIDAAGRLLLIHSGAIVSTHDLVDLLLRLPIGIRRCMYAEGGSEAQLSVRAGGRNLEFVGSYGVGLGVGDEPARASRIPNVIGIARRDPGVARTR